MQEVLIAIAIHTGGQVDIELIPRVYTDRATEAYFHLDANEAIEHASLIKTQRQV